jgi:sialate O-acetylesterase
MPDYGLRMQTLVNLWREENGNADLPVYQVEIAPFVYDKAENPWAALLREQQHWAAQHTDNCWIVSTADLVLPYESNQIHPARKREVGERLSYLALHHTYGKSMFPGAAPAYQSMSIEGSGLIIRMDHVRESGGFNRLAGVEGFEICGPDLVWHPAHVQVMGNLNCLKVSSPDVPAPVAVRYAFRNWLPGNLAGANGLAVAPFRTDRIFEGEIPSLPEPLPDDVVIHEDGTVSAEMMGSPLVQLNRQ